MVENTPAVPEVKEKEEPKVKQWCVFVGKQPIFVGTKKECKLLKDDKEEELTRTGADIKNLEFSVTIAEHAV